MDLTIEPLIRQINFSTEVAIHFSFFLYYITLFSKQNLMFNFRKTPLTSSLVEQFITSANVGAVIRN